MNFDWEFVRYALAKILQVIGLVFTSAGLLGEVRLRKFERYNRIFRRRIKLASFIKTTKPVIGILFFIIFIAGFLIPMVHEIRAIWLKDNHLEQAVSIMTLISFILGLIYLATPQHENLLLASSTIFTLAFFGNYLFKYSAELFMLIVYSSYWTIIPLIWLLSSQAVQKESLKDYAASAENPLSWKYKDLYSDDEQSQSFWRYLLNSPLWLHWFLRKLYFSYISLTAWVFIKLINILFAVGLYGLLSPYKFLEFFRLKLKLRGSIITIGIAVSIAGILLD